MTLVNLRLDGAVATITDDNPPVNALSREIMKDLTQLIHEIGESQAHVLVLRGGEKTFLSGADISEFPEMLGQPERVDEHMRMAGSFFASLGAIRQPVIAAVKGITMGGGLEVALACDLIIACENARFGLPELKLGLIPGGGGTQRLPRRVGSTIASRMIFLSETLDAEEALVAGLVSQVASEAAFDEAVSKAAERIALLSFPAVAAAKRALREGNELPLEAGLKYETEQFAPLFGTNDAREGYAAFMARRRPVFTHE